MHRELVDRRLLAPLVVAFAMEDGLRLHEQLARHTGRADRLRVVELAHAHGVGRGQGLFRVRIRVRVRVRVRVRLAN